MINDEDNLAVIDSNKLFDNGKNAFQGFMSVEEADAKKIDFDALILENYKSMSHKLASENSDLKELVACVIMANTNTESVSIYRSLALNIDVSNPFAGTWSSCYLGHVKSLDDTIKDNEPFVKDNIFETRYKDLVSEVILGNGFLYPRSAKLLGYINIETNPVIKSHFTMVYALPTSASEIKKKGANSSKMIALNQLNDLIHFSDVSNSGVGVDVWTKHSFLALCNYLHNFRKGYDLE